MSWMGYKKTPQNRALIGRAQPLAIREKLGVGGPSGSHAWSNVLLRE